VQEVTKTSMNKKILNLRAQSADKYKNGRIFHEYSLFRLAWNHHRFGFPKNLATALLPLELATLYSKERQGTRYMTVNLHLSKAIPN
jgi:hypothetical protein